MISSDPRFKEFLQNRQLRPNTERAYTQHLKRYSDITGLTLAELIEQAEDDEDKGLRMRKRRIKQYLTDYYCTLQDREYTDLTIKTAMMAVRTFYHEFEIQLPKIKIKPKNNSQREKAEDIPSVEDIKLAYNNANSKYQAIILLMVSSGMGSAEIRSLKIVDFLRSLNLSLEEAEKKISHIGEMADLNLKSTIPTWQIERIKTSMPYFTFSSNESVDAILRFLKQKPPQSINDPLFPASQFMGQSGGHISGNSFSKYFKRLNKKCGFPDGFFHSHALRKFFATTLTNAKMSQLSIDWMLGHSIDKTTEAYFKPTVERLKSDYLAVLPSLTVTEKVEVRVMDDEYRRRVEEWQQSVEEKVKSVDKHTLEVTETIRRLEEENRRLRKRVK